MLLLFFLESGDLMFVLFPLQYSKCSSEKFLEIFAKITKKRIIIVALIENMSRSMELEVWGGDWGLPSIDINCLQIMVCILEEV